MRESILYPECTHWTLADPGERELIERRIASARKWRRRRTRLLWRAWLLGRHKHRGEIAAPAPAASPA